MLAGLQALLAQGAPHGRARVPERAERVEGPYPSRRSGLKSICVTRMSMSAIAPTTGSAAHHQPTNTPSSTPTVIARIHSTAV